MYVLRDTFFLPFQLVGFDRVHRGDPVERFSLRSHESQAVEYHDELMVDPLDRFIFGIERIDVDQFPPQVPEHRFCGSIVGTPFQKFSCFNCLNSAKQTGATKF